MPTIKDVARAAGVSFKTVSNVLNDSAHVRPTTREKVLKAVEILAYRPNAVASSLRKRRTNAIGVLIPDIGNPMFVQMVRGIEDQANRSGHVVILCNTDDSPDKEEQYLEALSRMMVAGLIVTPIGQPSSYSDRLAWADRRVVFVDRVDRFRPEPPFRGVGVHNERGAYVATKHLVDLGHRRIGLLLGPYENPTSAARRAGYLRALLDAGLQPDPTLLFEGSDFSEDVGSNGVLALLDQQEPPTAILAGSARITAGCLQALRARGVKVPEEMSVVGYGLATWAEMLTPPLTTVSWSIYEVGAQAAAMLTTDEDEAEREPLVLLEPELVIRGSTGPRTDGVSRATRGGDARLG